MREAASVGAAMARLDRLGHLPSRLEDAGALGGLTVDPLAGLLASVGDGMLEAALAQLAPGEAVAVGEDAPVVRRSAPSSSPGVVTRPAVTGGPHEAPGAVPVHETSGRSNGRRPSAGPSAVATSARTVASTAPDVAPAFPSAFGVAPPVATAAAEAAEHVPLKVLSPDARVGASTPVALPTSTALSSPRVSYATGPPAPAGSLPPASSSSLPTSLAPGRHDAIVVPASRPATSPHELDRTRPFFERTELTRAATAPDRGGDPVHVAGLAGLVSWWDARDKRPTDEAGTEPATTPPAAAWSVADTPHEAPRTAEGAFESSPVVRLSLRNALEDLLLAEARASGIEVDP